MSASIPTRLSLLALASAVLGLFCVTGPIAIFVGWVALRAINGSDGQLRGTALAMVGLVTGGISVVLLCVGSGAIVAHTLREKSNRAECQYNLGKIGLAINVYHDNMNHTFPPAVLPPAGQVPEERLSWLVGILPFLEERPDHTSPWQPLASRFDRDQSPDAAVNLPAARTNVQRFLCRSHPYFDPRNTPGLTHYVGITGVGADSAALAVTDPRAGFFGYERVIGLADVKAGDSCTLLATETTFDNGPWATGGLPTVRSVDANESCFIGPGRAFGGCHRDGAIDILTTVYVDGSTRFLTSAINPSIFRSSACLAGDPGAK